VRLSAEPLDEPAGDHRGKQGVAGDRGADGVGELAPAHVQPLGGARDGDSRPAGSRVLDDVGQRLLDDPVHGFPQIGRECARIGVHVQVHGHARGLYLRREGSKTWQARRRRQRDGTRKLATWLEDAVEAAMGTCWHTMIGAAARGARSVATGLQGRGGLTRGTRRTRSGPRSGDTSAPDVVCPGS